MSLRIPKLAIHSSRQWHVRIAGKSHYLGKDLEVAERKYRDLIIEHYGPASHYIPGHGSQRTGAVTVETLITRYVKHRLATCDQRYQKKTEENYRPVSTPLIEVYGTLPAEEFGPKAFKSVRAIMAGVDGRSTGYVNKLCTRLKAAWKWGVSEELVSESAYRRLCTVPGLEPGELGLSDGREVVPVPDKLYQATLPYLSETCADFLKLLWICGARPGELVDLTPAELVKDGEFYVYRPKRHKTRKKNKLRAIVFGEESQAILKKYWPGKNDERFFGCYGDSGVIRKAVYRACDRAGLKRWHPYQLRHAAVTRISLEHGKEVAQAVAGHAKPLMTDNYDHGAVERAKRAAG